MRSEQIIAGVDQVAQTLATAVTTGFSRRKKELAPLHEHYVREVSSEDMALSLQTAVLLELLCEVLQPRRALDLGSGFSSFILRRAGQRLGFPQEVLSLDTDPAWLERSRAYVREQGLSDTGFGLWDSAPESGHGVFDLVFFDMDRPPARNGFLPSVLQRHCRPGTALLLDDLHMPGFRVFALDTLMAVNLVHVDCRRYTMDRFGRYASLFFPLT